MNKGIHYNQPAPKPALFDWKNTALFIFAVIEPVIIICNVLFYYLINAIIPFNDRFLIMTVIIMILPMASMSDGDWPASKEDCIMKPIIGSIMSLLLIYFMEILLNYFDKFWGSIILLEIIVFFFVWSIIRLVHSEKVHKWVQKRHIKRTCINVVCVVFTLSLLFCYSLWKTDSLWRYQSIIIALQIPGTFLLGWLIKKLLKFVDILTLDEQEDLN